MIGGTTQADRAFLIYLIGYLNVKKDALQHILGSDLMASEWVGFYNYQIIFA